MTTVNATQTENLVRIGDLVMTQNGVYVYGGENDNSAFTSITFDMRNGSFATLRTSPETVAPATLESTVNLKDSRISVTKQPENRPVKWVGPWASTIEGESKVSWNRTKRDGVEEMARKLVIRDWHENGGVVVVS